MQDHEDGRATFKVHSIEIDYQDTTYTAESLISNLDRSHYYDAAVFHITDDDFEPLAPLKCDFSSPRLGEKVYFGGFPVTQEAPSFHKARISTIEQTEDALTFHIDGTVLPGNSGGPVFAIRENQVRLIGMIFAEMANVDRGFIREKEVVKERLQLSTLQLSGVDIPKVICLVMDTVFDNLATGVGKVLGIKHVKDLTKAAPPPSSPSPFMIGYPVIDTERLPGKLATDGKYFEWYHRRVKGKAICGEIIGKVLYASDKIDKDDEKKLRAYYEANVLNSSSNGHATVERTTIEKWETLRNKILSAKPKGIRTHKDQWLSLMDQYQENLPVTIHQQLAEARAILVES